MTASLDQGCNRHIPAPVRTGAPSPSYARCSRVVVGSCGSLQGLSAKDVLASPGRPDDARQLVGERDGRLVVAACSCTIERPGAEAIVLAVCLFLRMQQHGTGTVDEQHADVGITALADRAELPPKTARRLPRVSPS
jgi:hypothetical protein